MESLILSEFDSCKLSVEEMGGTKGGCTSTRGATTACCSGDSDTGNRDGDANNGSESLEML